MGPRDGTGERRLGAIMFTDIVGYSAMASTDERAALDAVEGHRAVLQSVFSKYNGKVVKSIGDGFMVEFASAVDAVNCSMEAQSEMRLFSRGRSPGKTVDIRIGIHVGDVLHAEGDVMGDAVNVAARVEQLAEPGGVCVTRQVMDQVQRKVAYRMSSMGARELKNIAYPVEVFSVMMPAEAPSGEGGLDPRRIAVLPFSNMSADPNDRYFADGMTEELISTVSKIGELAVISRTSVMRYRDSSAPLGQIARELSVGSVLEGSVRKAGNKVRITAQLIDAHSDRHLWSQSYDRNLDDVFAIQADIAEQVAGALRVQLLTREMQSIRREATKSPDAYTLYLKGRFYWSERTEENTKKALKYFQEASKIDPRYAMAYSGMADAYSILSDYGWMVPGEALALAKSHAARALEIDDALAEAHASMGLVLTNSGWDMEEAEREFKRAIELKPNYAPALHWYSVSLLFMRRYEEAYALDMRALALDPYSRLYNMTTTNGSLLTGQYEAAIERYDELIKAHPDMSALRYWRSTAYLLAGKFDKAIEDAEDYERMEKGSMTSYFALHRAWVLAKAGKKAEASSVVEEAIAERARRSVSPTNIGWALLSLGRDEGYSWLEKAFAERDPALLYFNGFPWTKEFRNDPRWRAIESKFAFRSAPD